MATVKKKKFDSVQGECLLILLRLCLPKYLYFKIFKVNINLKYVSSKHFFYFYKNIIIHLM